MASLTPSWLKETTLHFEDIARHHTQPVVIYLPSINDNNHEEILAPQKYEHLPGENEKDFVDKSYQWKHLAQESGIFNQRDAFPRSLLWRKTNGGTLTIHSVDPFRPKTFPRNRALTAIHFRFPAKIQPNCIGFSDSMSKTTLYVLTEECVLYSISLSENVFSGEIRRPEGMKDTIRAHRPLFLQARFGQGKLSLDPPHFMYVLSDSQTILFAMQDGTLYQYDPIEYAILRFTGDATLRKALKTWIPTWSGHNPSHPSHLVLSAVASTKHSLLFTVSADQRLRIWSLERSQFLKEHDLTSSQATTGRLLPNSPARLLSLEDTYDHGEYLFYLITYNPLEQGQFVIWGAEHVDGVFTTLTRVQDPIKPESPTGRTGSWNINDFFLLQVKSVSDSHGTIIQNIYERTLRLWVAWKSYVSSSIQYTDIHTPTQWITIMQDDPTAPPDEMENSVEFWTDRITKPGRFTDTVLLTALNIYQERMLQPDQHRDLSSASRSLRKDLIAGVVGRKARLGVNQHSGQLDFEKYRMDLSLEFAQFEKTCMELSRTGEEFRRLSFDSTTEEIVVVRADGIVTIRNLSGPEILECGATGPDERFMAVVQGDMIRGMLYGDFKDKNVRIQVMALARAAFRLRCAASIGNLGDITAGLLDEVMSDSNFAVEDRLWAFYDKYLTEVHQGSTGLQQDIASTLASVTEVSAAFKALLDILSTDICQDDTVVPLQQLTTIWGDVMTTGVAETISARWILLRDFVLLSAYLYFSETHVVEPSDKKSIEGYWADGLRAFKGVNMLRHLANSEIAPISSRQSPEDQVSGSMEEMHLDDTIEVPHLPPRTSALRYLVEDTLDSSGVGINNTSFPPPMALSLVVASILTHINFADGYSGMAIRIVSHLLRLGANVEAARFARYLPSTPVGGYIWGHVFLQKGDWEKAGAWFSRIAPILAKSGRPIDFEYAKIILKGKQVDGTGKGLFQYYEHIARLFESKQAHSQIIYYCQRALSFAQEESSKVKDNLLMLSFNSAIDIASYDDAYIALTQLTNYETQRNALEILVVAMVEHDQSGRLCSFPFTNLQDLVDEILLRRAEEVADIRPTPSYHKVLFAWRIRHGDYQGAASVMYQRLQLLRNASTSELDVNLETLEISEAYLAIINALSCVSEKNAWIFISKVEEVESPAVKRIKRDDQVTRTRMAVSLEEIRKEYSVELERQQIILGKVADEFGLEGFDI